MQTPTSRKQYRATLQRALCLECDENIRRGMPIVYVEGRAIHAICEKLYELRKESER